MTMSFATISGRKERVLALLAAVGVSAAMGLAVTEPTPGSRPRVLPADANAQRAPGTPLPPPISVTPQGNGELDPALLRQDSGGDQHG
jgi:hypothetical protein